MTKSNSITARKRAEDRLRWMVESAPDVLLMVDSHDKIVLANTRAESFFGYTGAELIGLSIEKLIPPRFHDDHVLNWSGYLPNLEMRPMSSGRDLFCLRKDGREVPVEIGLNPMESEEGMFVVASIIDITERKKMEIEAARHRQELAHMSRVELISEFAGSMAHELNQPLSAMLTNSQVAMRHLARANPDIEELRKILADVVADNRRASDIVIRLRGWLKKEEPKFFIQNLNDLIRETIHFLKSELMFQNLECTLELEPNISMVLCDKIQIQQVLVNLLKNAWESSQKRPKNRRGVLIRTLPAHDDLIKVDVQDDGDGISEPILKQLFHPFMTTKPKGLGIGLSICRAIIESHKGHIWAENIENGGAIFHFTLPIPPKKSIN